jgi:hypothetical protein
VAQWFSSHESTVPWLLFVGLVSIYLSFPTRNYYWDGITFAQTIENATDFKSLIHPSHLLYNAVGYVFYHLLLTVGFSARALTALRILNALLSGMAAVILFFTLKSIFRSLYLAGWLTLLFGLSATWWKYSTDADAYIVTVLLLLIAFRFILPFAKARPVLVAVLYSLSMCFHELAIFFGPVVILGLLFQHGNTRQKIRSVILFAAISFVLISAVYFFCFYIASQTLDLRSFIRWLTYYSPDASFTFNIWNDLSYTLRGHFRLFLSGRLNLLQGLINPIVGVLIALLVMDLCVLAYLVFKSFRPRVSESIRKPIDDRRGRPLLTVSTVWASIYLIFLFVWLPQNTFYRLFYLPALIVVVGLFAWARYPLNAYQPAYRIATLTIAVALANFLFFIFPYSHAEKFPPTRFAFDMNDQWHVNTTVYYDFENSDNNLVRYFAPNTRWVQLKDPQNLISNLSNRYSEGRTVWLETTAIDRMKSTPEGAEWLKAHEIPTSRRALEDKAFRIEFVQVMP